MGISAPTLLTPEHNISSFTCGRGDLDEWLIKKALKNQKRGNVRVYVVTNQDNHQVIGFYAIAMGSVQRERSIGGLRRNSPNPIPMVILGRLGVHVDFHHLGVGAGLLKDCVRRSVQAMDVIGGAGILVHAIDDSAKAFYEKFGFTESHIDPLTLMAKISDIKKSL